MSSQRRELLPLWFICYAVALSGCGPGSAIDHEQEAGIDGYEGAVALTSLNFSSETYMHFGGMYGGSAYGPYANPYTGEASCPLGYTAYRTLGTPRKDYDLYFCGKVTGGGTEPIADFGGAFGWYSGGGLFNPMTGSTSCPGGYLTTQTLGTRNIDYDVRYCHRQHVAGTTSRYRFGGMYGGYFNGSTHTWYVNPITGSTSCPGGFTATRILGTPNVDYDLYFCYRDMGQ